LNDLKNEGREGEKSRNREGVYEGILREFLRRILRGSSHVKEGNLDGGHLNEERTTKGRKEEAK